VINAMLSLSPTIPVQEQISLSGEIYRESK
jgi:hypothetical protein